MTLTRHQQRALQRAQREVATAPLAEREAIYTRVISAARDHAEAAQAKAEAKRARKAEQRRLLYGPVVSVPWRADLKVTP